VRGSRLVEKKERKRKGNVKRPVILNSAELPEIRKREAGRGGKIDQVGSTQGEEKKVAEKGCLRPHRRLDISSHKKKRRGNFCEEAEDQAGRETNLILDPLLRPETEKKKKKEGGKSKRGGKGTGSSNLAPFRVRPLRGAFPREEKREKKKRREGRPGKKERVRPPPSHLSPMRLSHERAEIERRGKRKVRRKLQRGFVPALFSTWPTVVIKKKKKPENSRWQT